MSAVRNAYGSSFIFLTSASGEILIYKESVRFYLSKVLQEKCKTLFYRRKKYGKGKSGCGRGLRDPDSF